ncbi:MAG TPA: hypothetical protein VEH77_14245 [Roseiarcus sp.]|nr:hypothetical protein [Roseiarcus sp.]
MIDKYGTDRTAIRDGLAQIKDLPSVIYGKATRPAERRARAAPVDTSVYSYIMRDRITPDDSGTREDLK